MTRFTAIIVDPNQLFREGLERLLRSSKFSVLQSLRKWTDVDFDFASGTPNLIVFGFDHDVEADEQFEYLAKARAQSAQRSQSAKTRIILLTHSTEVGLLLKAASLGLDAALSRDISSVILRRSLELVMLGQQVFPASALAGQLGISRQTAAPDHVPTVLSHTVALAVTPGMISQRTIASSDSFLLNKIKSATTPLSCREDQILQLLVEGAPNKVIARDLGITEGTVKIHVKSVCRKLGAANRTQAAVWGQQH